MAIEKVWEPEFKRTVCDEAGNPKKDEHGKPLEETVRPWRIEATGKDVNELRGAFDYSGPELLHEGVKDWERSGGGVRVTRPDGSVDEVPARLEDRYRAKPGFCRTRIRPGVTVNGFGGLRAQGKSYYKAIYKGSTVKVLEER